MTHLITWDEHAIDQAARFLRDDPDGLRLLMDAVDLLAVNPPPEGATPYGSPALRRVHAGRYRVLYEIKDAQVDIVVIHVGRVG
ncbi:MULTISPECIES: type II toxin-antitoxin system RelE/ParE family toxin [unclassified Streptomyces]|uniref:type II toxin-antitoxin system RelE family toxin n=1 Tax=unclassified Streptomyces TaxID=2593676 RepID=UPI00203382B6|nr:type II toxin-antitoxin system RelE/ParE family toxin [Streptomyces sp. RKAG290]MCM2413503.1 type II toxin-antitoxin system RelE/ParE family toxin [Streptomyces sp. RKAG290]